ncbi:DNA-processing protein DprA [Cyanobium sp. WAJ14-Wanaka]|uniref:DNA-processing protein DprA n=1 Tax=Cyanobium sp. WAJ14-Wanaka TaxID=2823725 RepID=UPI0020CF97A6|nr:DNA-processing protein DprA [Cyanobium sp. WAJ14-Wanaka]
MSSLGAAELVAAELDAAGQWKSEQRLWWLLWSGCQGLGSARLALIEARWGDWSGAWRASLAELGELPGFGPSLLQQIASYRQRWGPEPLAKLARSAQVRRVLLPGDRAFPPALHKLERPPLGLYWCGRGSLWPQLARRQAIAVVGTRHPSVPGRSMARALGAALAQAGWPVVSGLAEGIDAAVHEGCLARGGRPVAVLGTPIERVYPRHHGALQRQVSEQGLLVSEQAPGAAVRAGNFAARNRLQVALAAGVVLVECPMQSGALLSAELAWRQDLPLWIVPADPGKVSAAGSNRLLARAGSVLLDPADLVHQLGPGPLLAANSELAPKPELAANSLPNPGAHRALLAAVGQGASLEGLCAALKEPPAELSTRLLQLELGGLLKAEPGLWWRPI